MAAMVDASQKTLTGVVASFAGGRFPHCIDSRPRDRAASIGAQPSWWCERLDIRAGYAYRPAPTGELARTASTPAPPPAPWAPERTALLNPAEDCQRQAPTRASEFGAELDQVLRSNLELAHGPMVELVRRTAKGEYAV